MRLLARATICGFRLAPIVLLVYWISIFTGTHLPGSAVPSIHVQDKLLHFSAFAGLAFLLAWSLPSRVAGAIPGVVVAAILTILYALIDEWTQGFIAHRTPSFGDLVADALGMLSGLVAYLVLRAALSCLLASSSGTSETVAPHSSAT